LRSLAGGQVSLKLSVGGKFSGLVAM